MKTIKAIYRKGAIVPVKPLHLRENTIVMISFSHKGNGAHKSNEPMKSVLRQECKKLKNLNLNDVGTEEQWLRIENEVHPPF